MYFSANSLGLKFPFLMAAIGSVADPVCLSGNLDPNFFPSRIRIFPFRIPDPGSKIFPDRIRIKEFKYFKPKIVSKLLEIRSGMFIPDPGLDFLPILEPESEKAPHPGSRNRNTSYL
jgi:hypothetical protein